ncbi:hypothetical protein NPIL_24231 [Nephila pilipes]|uniref:Uncharacterized protein n=1 Tax=Nephila pilipes TaxID=299642 RepID=A0A8X6N1C4_NEPPI|nr:hypothetical protein NPIL_24231 [Nephila pilipes]
MLGQCACVCDRYGDYVDEYHGHVVTGDLNLVNDEKLRNIMKRGTDYRLSPTGSNYIAKNEIFNDLDDFIIKIAIKYYMPYEAFKEFKDRVCNDLKMLIIDLKMEQNYKILDLL